MKISNKEVIDRLQEYFLGQDPKVVARILANQIIDLHRWTIWEELPSDEFYSLVVRSKLNSKTLQDFVKNGPTGDIKQYTYDSEETKDG